MLFTLVFLLLAGTADATADGSAVTTGRTFSAS